MNLSSDTCPTLDPQRIQAVDAVRGFALLGIFISIIHSFNGTLLYGVNPLVERSSLDSLLSLVQSVFLNLRFVGLFSLVFGLGIAILEQSRVAKGLPFAAYFYRRMAFLALFGLFNTTFLFSVEILLVYAVFGSIVYGLARLSIPLVLVLSTIAFTAWGAFFEVTFRDPLLSSFDWFREEYPPERMMEIYTSGSFLDTIALRWSEYALIYADNGFHMGLSFAMIVCGYVVGVKGLHKTFLSRLSSMRLIAVVAALFSLGFGFFCIANSRTYFIPQLGVMSYFLYLAFLLSTLFCYIYGVCFVVQCRDGKNSIARVLSAIGRLSLSGYMGVAAVYSLIFYTPGLGMYVQLRVSEQLLLSVAFYIAFSIFATVWLRRFRLGPMEWIYRKLA